MLAEIKAIEDKIREQICKDFVPLRRKELVEGRDIQPGHFRPQRPRAEPRAPQGDSASKERASTSRPVPEARHPLLTSKPVPIKSTPASTSPRFSSPPSPPTSPPPPPSPPPQSTISQSSARKIAKLGLTGKGKDPPLTFHTLDFAGQKLYRPMHHCFITQHAFYIVVFNLEDFVKRLNAKQDPITEIKYWMNNVYAHSCTKTSKQVILLVGTHAASFLDGKTLNRQDFERVHNELKKFIKKEKRFLPIVKFKCHNDGKPDLCFFPVENSKTKELRNDSGIAALQKHIIELVEKVNLPIKEERPVSWLKFEERLFRERRIRENCPLSTTRGDLKEWAKECGAPEFPLALKFFHDTGVIIDQNLMLSVPETKDDESSHHHESLVLLSPQWLAKIMTEVIELKLGTAGYESEAMVKFEDTGTIGVDVLRQCWEKLLDKDSDVVFDKILNVLETFFLLCPYRIQPEDEPPLYLVPSALPAAGSKDVGFTKECYTFYFEFPQYLPEEVYTHIVCVFLSFFKKSPTSLPTHELPKSEITSTCCKFCKVPDLMYNWKVTLLAAKQQLKVQASCPPNARHPPQSVIWFFHEQLLLSVCGEDTMLGSLEYYGGPLVECCACDESSVIPFIKSHDKEQTKYSFIKCGSAECPKEFDVLGQEKPDQKSSEQPQGQASPSQSHVPVPQQIITNIIKEGAHATFQQNTTGPSQSGIAHSLLTGNRLLEVDQKKSDRTAVFGAPPTESDQRVSATQQVQSSDQLKPLNTQPEMTYLLNKVAEKTRDSWEKIGLQLQIDHGRIKSISRTQDPILCFAEVFDVWRKSGSPPYTWATIIDALRAPIVGEQQLAHELQEWLTHQ